MILAIVVAIGVLLCIAMAINEKRRKRTETPELDEMIFQREDTQEE